MNKHFFKLGLTACLLALFVIVLGAYVRLSNAGLGCPDWPGCYGKFLVPDNQQEISQANRFFPDNKVESGKAWKEMLHRYFASILGLIILIIAGFAWKNRADENQQFYLPLFLVVLVIFQGMLGMWTVTHLLKPSIVTLHLLTGLLTLSLLCWLLLKHKRPFARQIIGGGGEVSGRFLIWARVALVVLALQIFLGGWTSTNYVALYCPDFPTCQGQWWPVTNFSEAFTFFRDSGINYEGGVLSNSAGVTVHVLHRVGALVTFAVLSSLVITLLRSVYNPVVRRVSIMVIILLCLQVSLGIANVLLYLPIPVAVSHNAVAALLMLSVIVLNYVLDTRRQHDHNK